MAYLGQVGKTAFRQMKRVIPIWTNEYISGAYTSQQLLNVPINARISGNISRIESGQPAQFEPVVLFYHDTNRVISTTKTDENGNYLFKYLDSSDKYSVIVFPIDTDCNAYIFRNISPVIPT
jgi:hypothetical protein